MKKPFFSIVTCTLDSECFLTENILSVKNQTFNNFEHIFIDGYSKDKTVEIIKKYQKDNKNNVKLHKKKPKGISNAMNEGIKKAKGEFIINLHSDDSFYDNKVLDDVYKYLDNKENLDWIYGKINVTEENGKKVGCFPNQYIFQIPKPFLLKFFNYIPHQAVFIRKKVFTKYGYFDESITSQMDLDLWLRIADTTKWNFFDRLISNFMIRSGAQSSGKERQSINQKNVVLVRKRHLNTIELFLFNLVNSLIEIYNRTRR